MRLGCPNCGAQYEVADDLIPPEGRDVQCSACGHTWFAAGATATPAPRVAAPDTGAPDWRAPPPQTTPEPEPAPAPPADPAPAPEGDHDPGPATGAAAPAAASEPPPVPPPADDTALSAVSAMVAASRSSLSEAAAAVLREEAAREEAARRAEAARPVEVQTDLGLESHLQPDQQRAEETRRRMARLKGEAAPPTTAPITPQPPARRDLFPDIEEINSTLRSTADRTAADMVIYPEDVDQRRGRWVGFSTVLVIFAILAAIYVFAPRIGQAVPQAAAVVTRYVEIVDEGRLWLDLRLQAILSRMQGATVPASDALPDALPQALPEPAPAPGAAPDVGTAAPDQAAPPAPDTAPAASP